MVRIEHYRVNSVSYIYGVKWVVHSEQTKAYICYEMSTKHWTDLGPNMVRNEHYTVNSLRQINGTNWALNSEQFKVYLWYEIRNTPSQFKVYLCYEMSITQWIL